MAENDPNNENPFTNDRRDWITDQALQRKRDELHNSPRRDRSPLSSGRGRDDLIWDKNKYNSDRENRRERSGYRSQSPEDKNRDGLGRERSYRTSPDRVSRRNTYNDNRGREPDRRIWEKDFNSRDRGNVGPSQGWNRDQGRRGVERENSIERSDRFNRDRTRNHQGSRDRSRNRDDVPDEDRSFKKHRSRERSSENSNRWRDRDRFSRDKGRDEDKLGRDRDHRNDRNISPKGDKASEKNVDNWGRELRLGNVNNQNRVIRPSPDRYSCSDRRRSPVRNKGLPEDRSRFRRSRERDWKKSVDDFLGSRESRGSSPSSRPVSRDRSRPVSRDRSRDSSKYQDKTEEEWDREIRRFERERSRHVTRRKNDDDGDGDKRLSPRQRYSPSRVDGDRPKNRSRSREQHQRGRSAIDLSPARNKSLDSLIGSNTAGDNTPIVDEKYDGEDMVISDDDNNESPSKNSGNDDWENLVLQTYNENSANNKFDYLTATPQKTVVVRCMPTTISEVDLHLDITSCKLVCHDIRLVRRKDTGVSRGFAFVEFYNEDDAAAWMKLKKGTLKFAKNKCYMEYSVPKDGGTVPAAMKFPTDWICSKCQAHNFSKRFLCYVCNSSRPLSENETSDVQASEYPTNTVVFRGLDVLSTEETVLAAIASLSNVPIRSVKIAKDPVTNISKGACFLEMNNVLDAFNLHKSLQETPITIDGKTPDVKYAKLDDNRTTQAVSILPKSATSSGRIGNAAIAAAQWSHQSAGLNEQYTLADVPRLAEYSASMYATNSADKISFLAYYKSYYTKQITEGHMVSLPANTAAGLAVAQAALASSRTGTRAAVTPLTEPPDGSGSAKYPIPDTSQYQYDPSSGFYYDPYTTLYYDASSQYYFNNKLSKYLYWDGTQQTYLPAPSSADLPEMSQANKSADAATIVGAPQPAVKAEDKKKEKEGDDRVKVAKRIAKDMEKWAKTLNQKKETAKQIPTTPTPTNVNATSNVRLSTTAGAADIGFAVLERKDHHLSVLDSYYDSVQLKNEINFPVLAPPHVESDEEDESAQEDRSHTDWERLICLLCKRQLGSREALIKHQQMSDLHKQNLAQWYRARGLDPDDAQKRKNQYRDRASERRQKYGLPDTPKPSKLKETYIKARESAYEQPTTRGIGSDNRGSKLLQKMGWQEGMGLGKSNQGRTSLIETKTRASTAGLGSRATGVTPAPGETYKECVKKMMASRYAQIND